jgi:hypothetical protein
MSKLLLIFMLVATAPCFGESEIYSRVVQKHIKKVRDRWTLEDLYLTRKYSPRSGRWSPWKSPMFEMLVDFQSGPGQLYKAGLKNDDTKTATLATEIQFHYGALGFGLTQSQTKLSKKSVFLKRDDLTLYYRVLGPSTQSTHLTFLVGYQGGTHNDYGDIHQQYYGALTNLYLFRHFGLEGQYQVRSETQTSTYRVSGMHYHWGIFCEFSILRVYLNFFQDYQNGQKITDNSEQNHRVSSTLFGARLAF